jgi:hypothetical protein
VELTPERATEIAEQVHEISPNAAIHITVFTDEATEGAPTGSRVATKLNAPDLGGLIEQLKAVAALVEREGLRYDESQMSAELVLRHENSHLL